MLKKIKPVVLTNWILRRRGVDVPVNSFKFEKHFVLHPNRMVKIYAKDKAVSNPPHDLVSETIVTWGVGTYAYTQLVNHLNQEKSSLLEKVEHYERDLPVSAKKQNGSTTTTGTQRLGRNGPNFFNNNTNPIDFNELNDEYDFYYEKNVRNY